MKLGGPGIGMMFTLLIMLAVYVFVIYVLVCVLRFMKRKTELDQERNEKLDRLIQALEKKGRDESGKDDRV